MHVLEGLGPQETRSEYENPYDHPYFGQLFLAAVFSIIDYPSLLLSVYDGSVEELKNSIEQLHLFPRVLTGILAVVDTFLIYKITQIRYTRRAAFVAAVLFAVMPLTWLSRRVVLESIFLPFILLSILYALYLRPMCQKNAGKNNSNNNSNRKSGNKNKWSDKEIQKSKILILISGILLGLAIFTKFTAVIIVPLLIYLIFVNSGKSFKSLRLWFFPVVLIPMIWPAYALMSGQLHEWVDGILWQSGRDGRGLYLSFIATFKIDPILWIVGLSGVALVTAIRKDLFFVLWLVPFLLFLSLIPFIQHFHWLFLLPMLCMAAGVCISDILSKIIIRRDNPFHKVVLYAMFSAIFIFGFVSTALLLSTNLNGSLFDAQALVIKFLPYSSHKGYSSGNNEDVILMGNNWMHGSFSWMTEYIFDKNYSFKAFAQRNLPEDINTKKVLLLIDGRDLERYIVAEDRNKQERLYNNTHAIAEISEKSDYYKKYRDKYPYTSIHENRGIEGGKIIIRANY